MPNLPYIFKEVAVKLSPSLRGVNCIFKANDNKGSLLVARIKLPTGHRERGRLAVVVSLKRPKASISEPSGLTIFS